jgi:hypothetical protein
LIRSKAPMNTPSVCGSAVRLWFDGRLAAETRGGGGAVVETTKPLQLGPFIGLLDEIRLYDRVLSPDELAILAR